MKQCLIYIVILLLLSSELCFSIENSNQVTKVTSQNKYKEIEKKLKKAIEDNPKDDKTYIKLVTLFTLNKEYKNAIDIAKKALQVNPKNYDMYFILGNAYLGHKEYKKVLSIYKKAMKIIPKNHKVYGEIKAYYEQYKNLNTDMLPPIYTNAYKVGDKIAEGVSLSIVFGLTTKDENLKYKTKTLHDVIDVHNMTFPLIKVSTNIESKVLGDFIFTYYLVIEKDMRTNHYIGTVKVMRVNGNINNSLASLNNTMFIEDEKGTRQVQNVNGELKIVD